MELSLRFYIKNESSTLESPWSVENGASGSSRDLNFEPAASSPVEALVVERLLSNYPAFKLTVGPTLPAALVNALLQSSFYSLAQALEDAAAPPGLIIDFRRQWRRFHLKPDIPHRHASLLNALKQPTFGAAAAFFVDMHVSDHYLGVLITSWRIEYREDVSQRVPPYDPPAPLLVAIMNSCGSSGRNRKRYGNLENIRRGRPPAPAPVDGHRSTPTPADPSTVNPASNETEAN
ncbi:hypothetical protein B0H11DRAFT_2231318 [Mycena galericulata]|nr:hypothetical protein B0H11DRAFT_2231318 [Mycena galericulata]